mmetsp:Transcript_16142/g.32154  ORF Transcript_16142/g.32154 Transcript_16142/m.32154 type:complete len:225 (-) Transcript_16142:25-699(-)
MLSVYVITFLTFFLPSSHNALKPSSNVRRSLLSAPLATIPLASAASPPSPPTRTLDQTTTTLLRALSAYSTLLSASPSSSYLQTRVGSYVLLKNSLPPSLTSEYMDRYEYAEYYPARFLRLVGSDFGACLRSHAYYFPDSSRPLEDVRYDLSSLVEFDGLMSLEANGFPRFALLIAQRDARKEDYARNVARRVVENLEEAIAKEDDATRDRAAKLLELYYPLDV